MAGLGCIVAPAMAQGPYDTPVERLWSTDGSVTAMAVKGNTLYIGGLFDYVGPNTGGGVPLEANSGTALDNFPFVDGGIRVTIPDGSGGWYIGGGFTQVGNLTRNNIAHIKNDYTVDTAWNPSVDFTIRTLALSDTTLYIGGFFSTVNGQRGIFTTTGGQNRNYIAALDTGSGAATAWNPNGR